MKFGSGHLNNTQTFTVDTHTHTGSHIIFLDVVLKQDEALLSKRREEKRLFPSNQTEPRRRGIWRRQQHKEVPETLLRWQINQRGDTSGADGRLHG